MPAGIPPTHLRAALATARALDVRSAADFACGHLHGAGHLPAAELAARSFELPPRDSPVLVIAEDGERAHRAAAALEGLGFERVLYLDASPSDVAGAMTDRGPGARLWSPAPFLLEVADRLPAGRALDVAAGTCRNAVYLACRGHRADAVDRAEEALQKGRALAAREGATITTWVQDLERDPRLPRGCYQVVMCFRFLHRPLFSALADALAPDGHLVYETYRKGARAYPRPRRPRFLLEPGELRAAFPQLVVMHYSEPEPEGGPATARIWARRS